jgi:hypothetical protein
MNKLLAELKAEIQVTRETGPQDNEMDDDMFDFPNY